MFIRFLFSITLVLSSVVVMAQPVIQFTGDNINIGKSLLILKDSSNTLTFDEVINNDNFQLSEQKVPNLGISNSTFWLKFKIQNHTDSKLLLLDLSQPGIDHIEFYKIDADGRVTKEEYGESLPYSKRNYSHPDYVFNLKINEGDIHTYLLKVKSGEQIQIPLTLGRPLPILEALATKDMLFGLYVGIMSVMLLYNLFIYFSIKDKSYLFYVIYIFIVTLTQANFQGYAFRFLWPESSWVATNAVYILSAIVGMSAAVFMMFFLNTRQNVPHLHKGLFIFITIYIITILMGVAGFHNLSFKIVEINAMLTALYQLYISFIISKQGYRPAKFFLYAWIIFLIGVCIFVLKDLGVLPYNNFTYYTMPAGSAIEVVLLSFGLADRINILKKEKEESQAKALEILKENERIIKEQNTLLERKVRERTLELEEANKEISRTLHALKETQSQLVNAEKMASLGQLTAGIAHEMNNPINFVASNVKPLKQDVNDLLELLRKYDEISLNVNLEEKLKEVEALKKEIDIDYLLDEIDQLLKGIDDGASRTTEIVKGLRNFSRLDEDDLKKTDIHLGLNSTLTLLTSQLNTANIQVVKEYNATSDLECYPGKLNQVFMNILSNAIQAIQKNNLANEQVITIKTSECDGNILISVKDTGVGISPNIKNKIFDPFFTTKEVGEGTGLGLSIVYSIIQTHHGKIEVESEEGKGTEFILTLPLVQQKVY